MELWTSEHAKTLAPALVCMLALSVVLRKLLRDKPLHIRMIPVQILTVFLILLEIGKQTVSFSRGYDLYHIPLHYCSLVLFTMPLMAFYRGKYRQTVNAVTTTFCTAMTLLTVIYPNLIYSAGNIQNFFGDYLDFHTVAFHNAVIWICFLIIALDLHTVQPMGEVKTIVTVTTVFCVISASTAHILQTNYANFYSCNIPPLEEVRLSIRQIIGVVPTQILYAMIVSVLTILFTIMCYWLYRWVKSFIKPTQKITV